MDSRETSTSAPLFGESTDRDLVMRMRSDDERAWGEYFDRFRELLVQEARRCGVQPALRDEVVLDCLADTALVLMRHTTPIPRSLPGYLSVALRNAVLNAQRSRARDREQRLNAVWDLPTDLTHAVIREAASEYSLRASGADDGDAESISPALKRLGVALDATLTDDERRILGWVGYWISQAQIAEWLGVSYGSLRVRLLRLRDRLREAADAYVRQADAGDQEVLRTFLRRASIRDGPGERGATADGGSATLRESARESEREEEER